MWKYMRKYFDRWQEHACFGEQTSEAWHACSAHMLAGSLGLVELLDVNHALDAVGLAIQAPARKERQKSMH